MIQHTVHLENISSPYHLISFYLRLLNTGVHVSPPLVIPPLPYVTQMHELNLFTLLSLSVRR